MSAVATRSASSPAWRLWVAPLIWAAHFLAIYAFTALSCARNVATASWLGVGSVTLFIVAATLAAAAALLVTIGLAIRDGIRARTSPAPTAFVHWLTAAIGSLVLLAVLWETLPVLVLPVCG